VDQPDNALVPTTRPPARLAQVGPGVGEPDAGGHAGSGPLAALLRRWPLVAVALVVGLGCGALLHVTSTRSYRSAASLLVLKKRESNVVQDARANTVEDYVSAQVSFIKSEKIRRAAAAELRRMPVARELPDDDGSVAAMIAAGLDVTKDRDAGSPNIISNGIVNLTFRGPDPRDTQLFLEAVITAYQKELSAVYDSSTTKVLANLELTRITYENIRKKSGESLLAKNSELSRITAEDVSVIRGRVSAAKEKANALALQVIDYDRQLATIKKAGPNRRDRMAAFAQITGQTRAADAQANTPEQAVRLLDVQRKALSERLGRDHPQMKELDAQIAFQKAQIAEQNPADPTGLVDDLRNHELYTTYKADTARLQLADLKGRLFTEEKILIDAGQLTSEIEQIRDQINKADLEIRRVATDTSVTNATKTSGGFEATAITPPNYGGQVAPVLVQSLLVGLVLGGLLAGAAVAAAELSDRSFRSPAEIRRRLGVPVIGHIPMIDLTTPADAGTPTTLSPGLVTALRPKSVAAETYRGVRTQLYFSTQGRGHQLIQVTSPNPGDGKSTLAANLAVTIAQSGKRVVLLDCDFRKPQVHKLFQLGKVEAGLADVVGGTAPMAKALRRSPVPGLDLMPCGTRPANPSELLTSPRFQQILADLKDAYDFVIVDTPPVLAVSDPGNVAARVDGVILVVRLTKNSRPAAEHAYEALSALGANLLGVVVNAGESRGGGYADYNYGSRAGYRYADYEYSDKYGDAPEAEAPALPAAAPGGAN